MRFIGASNYDHGTKPKIGVLLTNLGTPEAPTAKALRPYLKQFLWDPRVVEVPRLLWWMILHAFILTSSFRPCWHADTSITVSGMGIGMDLALHITGLGRN